MHLKDLSLPGRRADLLSVLVFLSNERYQYDVINDKINPQPIFDDFGFSIDFLFDDTGLSTVPSSHIGEFLHDNDEVQAVSELISIFDKVYNKYDCISYRQYIEDVEWPKVVKAASHAYQICKLNESDKGAE
jgi:hypothetical protein